MSQEARLGLTGGTYWLDSLVALLIALVVAFHAIKLLRKVALEHRHNLVGVVPRDAAGRGRE